MRQRDQERDIENEGERERYIENEREREREKGLRSLQSVVRLNEI